MDSPIGSTMNTICSRPLCFRSISCSTVPMRTHVGLSSGTIDGMRWRVPPLLPRCNWPQQKPSRIDLHAPGMFQ